MASAAFGALQDAIAGGETSRMVFYAFDLAHLNGWDLTAAQLVQRKTLLEKLLRPVVVKARRCSSATMSSANGGDFFDRVSAMELEGVVSKRTDSRYVNDRSKTWLKAKAKRIETLRSSATRLRRRPVVGGVAFSLKWTTTVSVMSEG